MRIFSSIYVWWLPVDTLVLKWPMTPSPSPVPNPSPGRINTDESWNLMHRNLHKMTDIPMHFNEWKLTCVDSSLKFVQIESKYNFFKNLHWKIICHLQNVSHFIHASMFDAVLLATDQQPRNILARMHLTHKGEINKSMPRRLCCYQEHMTWLLWILYP